MERVYNGGVGTLTEEVHDPVIGRKNAGGALLSPSEQDKDVGTRIRVHKLRTFSHFTACAASLNIGKVGWEGR